MARNLNGKEATSNGYVHGGDEKNIQGGTREIPLVFGQDECVFEPPVWRSEGCDASHAQLKPLLTRPYLPFCYQ